MAIAFEAPSEIVEAINFGFYSHDEVRKLSVKKITRSELLDAKGIPVPDGLYDPAMGAVQDSDSCKSCGQLAQPCPGHCGHIELVMTLYNPLLFDRLKRFLQITCFHCHKFRINEEKVRRYVSVLKCIIDGDVISARSIEATALSKVLLSTDAEGEDTDMDFEVKRDVIPSYKSPLGTKDTKRTWTSLQYAEGIAILSKFMKENHKKCANCGKANPRITSPTSGWLNKTEQSSDIRANIILNAEVGLPSNDEDRPDNEVSSDDSQSDEEFSAPANASEQSKNMTADFFEEIFSSAGQKHLLPSEAEQILGGLWENEPELCMLICNIQQNNSSVSNKGYAMFFLKDIIVPPCKFRLPALGGRGAVEHPQNVLLAKVQESNIMLQKLIMTDPMHVDTIRRWMDLQRNVNVLYDSSKGLAKSERDNSGIRQLLEKKTGILRQKMMGKRVNFACRSVISPDPCLAVNEIGIPPDFALKLTYPERVTPWNVHKMRHAIMNGANIYPGASHYVDKDRSYKLQLPRNFRSSIARKLPTSRGLTVQSRKGPEYDFEGKIVYRHIQDGDIVLVNRQPTLHKPSTMAHVVRVLKREKTLRMHYANCSTYNADFDGDEMNVHFPQDEISRSEAINIVNANKQYIVPTSGDPIRGLIQDHIVSAVLLSKKDLFLTREEYHQLLYASCVPPAQSSQPGKFGQKVCTVFCHDEIQPLSPAIWKPKPLWTGNQVIAAILCHITRGRSPFTVEKAGRIPKEYFAEDGKESKMYISNNDFIHGMIDKAQFGKYGLVHTVHELYGADIAGTLLSIFSRLFTTFLHMNGFTCGVDDLLLLRESDKKRKDMLEKSEALSEDVHFRFTATKKGDIDLLDLHREIEKILRSQGEPATVRLDRMMSNALNLLTSEVNKALFPNGLQKPFPKNCLSLMTTTGAKGGLVNLTQISSLLGQQELEGKRVPRIISGKTLPCFPPWDTSCRAGGFISDRFLTGLRPQEYYFHCMAGRDGLVDTAIKTSRSGYLQRCLIKSLESLKVCYDYTVRDADGSIVQFVYGEDGVDVLKASYITELEVLVNNQRVVLESLSSQLEDSHMSKSNDYIKDLPDKLREKVISFARQLSAKGQHCIKRKDLMKLIKLKYMSSLADPGEAVGVIAAQSVGEPSTQMTLNTFHLAGRGEMNVTLGIPRLQEILKSAKENIRTPIMTCPLLEGKTKDDGERLAAKLRRICIADLVQSINVSTLPFFIHQNHVSTLYKLKMKLYPSHLLPQNTVELEEIMAVLRTTFVDAMEVAITKHLDLISKISYIEDTSSKAEDNAEEEIEDDETGSKSANGEDNGGEKDDDEGDDDYAEDQGADAEKRKRQKCDEMEYEDGIEKEKSAAVMHDLDGGVQSGSESDQGEVEDDFEVGRDDPKSSSDREMPDSGNKMKPLHEPEVSEREKKTKKVGRGKKKTKKVGRRKKIDSVIFVEAKGNIFEAHFKLTNESHILLAEIAQNTAQSVYVKQSKNIDRCSVVEPKRSADRLSLQTAGVNFLAFWDMQDHLDIDRVVTNNIHAMLNTYGVEAARATIINEVKAVFDPYGIKVNTRHLSLIADYMSAHGGYRPMNMIGMNKFNTSPFGKMTFETATRVIVEAAFYGEGDTLESPSASISLGRPVKFGTGVFDLMQKI